MTDSIWNTLSAIDCSDHIEQKGQFSYLAWTWAWAKVKEVYPTAHYTIQSDTTFPDGTMEVRVEVVIPYNHHKDSEGRMMHEQLTHTMWLPVLDFKNKPIPNPNAFDINTARMRCLVKCLAMFGLGHYIYAGESAPAPSADLKEKYEELVALVAQKKGWELREFTTKNQSNMDTLFNMAPDGKKTRFKADVREVYQHTNDSLKRTLGLLEAAVGDPDNAEHTAVEIVEELGAIEREFVWQGMNETLRHQVEEQL